MNITHFVENLGRGGLERMVLDLVKLQHRQGHRCQVVCLFERGALASELDELNISVTACEKRQGFDLRALARARRLVRSHATEILHTHNAVAHYQAVLATTGLSLRRVINTRHGMGGKQRSGRREWLYRRALPRTNTVVTVCEAARRDAIARGIVPQEKAVVVPNGICVESFHRANEIMHTRLLQMLQCPAHARVIGTVGRLNWAKDQVSLIQAFRIVHEKYPATVLVLVGDGELRGELEQCAQNEGVTDAVFFLGDRNDVRALLQGFDLFVLSSVSEGYSMALLEACAVALPIVATDVGGNGEIVRNGINGRLVPASDPRALADAMMALLQDTQGTTALGQTARTWVEQHGSLEAMAAHYDRLYQGTAD